MSLQWLLFTNLIVLSVLVYNSCFNLSRHSINAFTYTLILGCAQVLVLLGAFLAAKYGFKIDLIGDVKTRGGIYAFLAGLAVIRIDISSFVAFRKGPAVLTNTYCSIAGLILFTLLSMAVFNETLTFIKRVGTALGITSLGCLLV